MKQLCLCASSSFAVGVWVPLRLPSFPGRCSAGAWGGAAAGRGPDVEGGAEGRCAPAGSAERCGIQVLEDTADNDLGTVYAPGHICGCSSTGQALILQGTMGPWGSSCEGRGGSGVNGRWRMFWERPVTLAFIG